MLIHIGAGQWVDPREVTGVRALSWDVKRDLPCRVEVDHGVGHNPAMLFTETLDKAIEAAEVISDMLNAARKH